MGKTIQIMIDKRGCVTNGDVIKTLFPKIEVKEYPNDPKRLKVSILRNGYFPMASGSITKSWWNAPYKAESEDKE